MRTSAAVCRYMISLAEPILADLSDAHAALEPRPGTKTARWILGHLAVSGDYGRCLCGQPPLCPADWGPLFAPGSQPSHDANDYPRMEDLRRAFVAVYADLVAIATTVDPDRLEASNPYSPAVGDFSTSGDFIVYLMTAHLAYHLGQLAGWRSAAGLGRVPRENPLAA